MTPTSQLCHSYQHTGCGEQGLEQALGEADMILAPGQVAMTLAPRGAEMILALGEAERRGMEEQENYG